MEPYDPPERFFRLVKQPDQDCILRDDFLPYIKALLNDHPVRFDLVKGKNIFWMNRNRNCSFSCLETHSSSFLLSYRPSI